MPFNFDAQQLQGLASGVAAIVATLALVFAILVDRRNHSRFQRQLELSRNIAEAQNKPILFLFTVDNPQRKAVILKNAGAGTAILTEIRFEPLSALQELSEAAGSIKLKLGQGKQTGFSGSLADLLSNANRRNGTNYWLFYGESYLPANEERVLAEVRKSVLEARLTERNDSSDVNSLMEHWLKELAEISVTIEYHDIFRNQQPAVSNRLRDLLQERGRQV